MKPLVLLSSLLACVCLAGCPGAGPDIVDPDTGIRSETSIHAISTPAGSDLAILKEPNGFATTSAYSAANGSALDQPIDGIFQSFDLLYLVHRRNGTISVVDVESRTRRAVLSGFGSADSATLCGMAFSNLSQGWVINYDSPNIYHVDAVRTVVVDTFGIEGRPTSIATTHDKVLVATHLPDGSARVSMFQSNFSTFRIDATLPIASPVIFMAENGSKDAVVAIAAGRPGGRPVAYVLKVNPLRVHTERELDIPDLTAYIGRAPEYAMMTLDNYLYLATPSALLRIDVKASTLPAPTWLEGAFSAIGVDFWTGLLYAFDPASMTIKRVAASGDEGVDLEPIPAPARIHAIEFVNSSKVR